MEDERQNQPEGQQSSYPGAPAPPPGQEQRTSGLAIWSLVLAFLCAPVGLVLGIIALVQINKDPQRLRGRGLAIAGTVIGAIVTVMLSIVAILSAIAIPSLIAAREKAKQTACLSNLKQLGTAMLMYHEDWGESPAPEKWNDALEPYVKNPRVLRCPSEKSREPSYAMNDRLRGLTERDMEMPGNVVALFDSIPGRNKAGGPELLPDPPRHRGGHSVAFLDGHTKSIKQAETADLQWQPRLAAPPEPGPQPVEPGELPPGLTF